MFYLSGNILTVETKTQTVTFSNGAVTKIAARDGRIYTQSNADEAGCSLVWARGETRGLDTGTIETRLLNEKRAEIIYHSWYGDGVVFITEDDETGDVIVRPAASSGRAGVRGCRFDIRGIEKSLSILIPAFQGVKLAMDDPLLTGENAGATFNWPHSWEMGLIILESAKGGGLFIHCRDDRYKHKQLVVGAKGDPYRIGLVSEANGPVDSNKSAGGIDWRINVFEGGWRTPAAVYKNWYWNAYGLQKEKAKRAPWLSDIRLAYCWSNGDAACLDALARHVDPKKVLIHLSDWRDYNYDQNYPDYMPSASAARFIEYGSGMGFKIAPHANAMEIDPAHAVYPMFSDFQSVNIDDKTVYGWGFDGADWRYLGVPWTERAKTAPENRRYNIMVKLHTGLSLWHSELYGRLKAVAENYPVAACFTDVSNCVFNLHNCIVEGRTPAEGVNDMIKMLSEINGCLPIGGEGLNEITAQGLSFAQMHLFNSYHKSIPGLERCGGDCAVNDFVFGELCRTIGYAGLSGKNEDEIMRKRIHDDHNTIPTIIENDPRVLLEPNETIKGIYEDCK